MNPRNPFLFSLLFLLFNFTYPFVSSENLIFNFTTFSLRNLTLLGDSYLHNGIVGLTRKLPVPSSSSGTVIYNNPIPFFDQQTNTTASFSTTFSFSITDLDATTFGDGLTFFISPDNQTLGSPGGYLGLVNSSQLTKNKFVAVEFDTRLDSHFNDPNDNHVGLDIDSLNSIKTANVYSTRIDLKTGVPVTAWIEYKNDQGKLLVFLNKSSSKPKAPLLVVNIDLSAYLKEFKYVGFSASREASTELHRIANWSFTTHWDCFSRPRFTPHNVSDNSVIINRPTRVSKSNNKHHKKLVLGLGISGTTFFCAVFVLYGLFLFKRLRGSTTVKKLKTQLVTGPRQFSYRELKLATKGFHPSRIIGNGAFGSVYKAFFSSATLYAVKRSKHSHQGKIEFLAELNIIACLRHKNLVPLQGWCIEKGELFLVYEFMPNGSLDKLLYLDSFDHGTPLKWGQRYKIAVGLASVLTYLHQECEQQVIHRDIKTSNIMLDANFNARLGDFGLARLMDHNTSPVSTLTAGTMGYLAPEYLQYGKATEKTDVFSFGVVMLELACGRRSIERELQGQDMVNLVDFVWGLYSEDKIVEAADKRLNGEFDEDELRLILLVGLSCANPVDNERPSMRRVMQILNKESDSIAVPRVKPTLTFSNGLPLSLEEIVSDDDGSGSPDSTFEVKVE